MSAEYTLKTLQLGYFFHPVSQEYIRGFGTPEGGIKKAWICTKEHIRQGAGEHILCGPEIAHPMEGENCIKIVHIARCVIHRGAFRVCDIPV